MSTLAISNETLNSVSILGWSGYNELLGALRKVQLNEYDTVSWLPEEYDDRAYAAIRIDSQLEDNASALLLQRRSDCNFIVVDREYKARYKDDLVKLKDFKIYPDRILYSALPLLAAREYYTIEKK